jgi:hypothetical protein
MTATVTGSGTATRAPARARWPAARRGLAFPRASTTPGKVRLIRIGLVIACLGWGALAALMVEQHASAAHDVASVSEPLSLEAPRLVIGSGSGTAGTLFSRLEADLDTAIRAGQSTFAGSTAAGSGAFTGLEAGVAVLALIMAIGSARGLSRRLAEYR